MVLDDLLVVFFLRFNRNGRSLPVLTKVACGRLHALVPVRKYEEMDKLTRRT